jgi:hypothetical protein
VGGVGQTSKSKDSRLPKRASERSAINGDRVPRLSATCPGFHGLGDEQIGCDGRLRGLDLRKGEATGLIPP